MKEKIYIVHYYDDPYEPPAIASLFKTKEAAEKYIEDKKVEYYRKQEKYGKDWEDFDYDDDDDWLISAIKHDGFVKEYEVND